MRKLSNKTFFDEKSYKYFIGYLYNDNKVKALNIMLPKTSAYIKVMRDKLNGCIYSLKDNVVNIINAINIIWDNLSGNIKKKFDSKPICNKNYLKPKIKCHGDEVTNFYNKERLTLMILV